MNFNFLIVLLPLLLVYSSSAYCPIPDSGTTLAPPPIVFSLVWPTLLILLGVSSIVEGTLTPSSLLFYILLVLSLTLWPILYSCFDKKKYGVFVILSCILFALLYLCSVSNTTSRLCVVPLLTWLIFALLLNSIIVTSTETARNRI